MIDLLGRFYLFYAASIHHHHSFVQCHRLNLVVGSDARRYAELAVRYSNLKPGLHAQLGIQITQRFVKQKHLRLAHDGMTNCHALPLATVVQFLDGAR